MRILLVFLLLVHGLIHLFGFLKAFNIYQFEQLTQPISKTQGVLWLIAAALFGGVLLFYLFNTPAWFGVALAAVLLSQGLIILNWTDAKFGTIANLIILGFAFLSWQAWRFEQVYKADVQSGLESMEHHTQELLTEADLQHLPGPVQRYIRYSGVVNQPKVHSFRADFEVEMRNKGQDWMTMTAEQHNFFDTSQRLFFLKAKVKGIPAQGYHLYKENQASMDVRLLSVLPIVHASGPEMFEAETVTFFNDMCIMAPAALIDQRIKWTPVDSNTVRAAFTHKGTTIEATLFFNREGQLINFESDDRYDINAMQKYRFSTPLSAYGKMGNAQLAKYGEAIWHYPDGPFVYGKFKIREVVYNP
ncbi:MAG: hypothetical protein RIC19_02630 [Phaeodactylibacter sp.]|uniref:DUF6544 family protein n=1 Tax=Phaeodactylibacter sp. TaxID=1940289 RepID=UPI0032EDAE16